MSGTLRSTGQTAAQHQPTTMNILVTGSGGFIGRHLMEALGRRSGVEAFGYQRGQTAHELDAALNRADIIFHLAGVNRPQDPSQFKAGNADLTKHICARLQELGRTPVMVLSSSIQATLNNPYGSSKREAEEAVQDFSRRTGASTVVFRLQNVFGKWCRPNYNSVTATFCYNVAHDLPVKVVEPGRELGLVYIDDVVAAILGTIDSPPNRGCCEQREVSRVFRVTVGQLAALITSFRDSRRTLIVPDFSDEFIRSLYATYLSYLEGPDFGYSLEQKSDSRGSLAEFLKSASFGQIFVSRTNPGITRGNHYHQTKTEKFLVVEGEAVIRFRQISDDQVIEHRVSGKDYRVLDIPPGYTHSIENVGDSEMVTLFWASEIFDSDKPDTYFLSVQ